MITLARILFAPLKPFFDWADRRCNAMVTEALVDAEQCPDEIEPPDEYARQEYISERILDAANSRWFERGEADVALWEHEVSSDA